MKVAEGKEIEVLKEEEFVGSEGQERRRKLLEGLKLKLGKVKKGRGLVCKVCGKKSKVENSLFVEVIGKRNGKEERGLLSKGCGEKYYGLEFEGNGSKGSIGFSI